MNRTDGLHSPLIQLAREFDLPEPHGRRISSRESTMSLSALSREIDVVITLYEREIGVPAARTRQMIERHGAIEALSKLVVSADLQSGFRILRDRDQLDSTFEALIVRHKELFRKNVVEAAQWRLRNASHLR